MSSDCSMSQKILVDTGPIVALLSSEDNYHLICVDTLKKLKPPLITCWAVITEVHWLVRKNKKAVESLFLAMSGGLIEIVHLPEDSNEWLKTFLLKYHDTGAQLADASLCYLAEVNNIDSIFTLDRRDFSIYRLKNNKAINIVPEL